MTNRETVSRRTALLLAVPVWAASRGSAQERISKTAAKYQDHPNGQQRCEICLQFNPPDRCKLVDGAIGPHGWCQFFAARENAR